MAERRNHINFRTEEYFLKELVYSDNVYAWLLLHSYYNPEEKYNYIYKDQINFSKMAMQIHRSRQTISKRFKKLEENNVIREYTYNGKKCYKIPYFKEFEEMDGDTVFQLLCLPIDKQKEELIKTYAYLLKKKRISEKEGNNVFYCSSREVIQAFGYSATHKETYERIRLIFTFLQGAGIIKFRTILPQQMPDGTWQGPKMEVYEVRKRAPEEWLGMNEEDIKKEEINKDE